MSTPFFTVLIGTRNRPRLLRQALESVIGQDFDDFNVLLINDGSDQEHMAEITALCDEYADKVRRIDLVHYPRGHGQSYTLNTGALNATGRFLATLDDDDFWTDMQHLSKAHEALSSFPDADVYLSNQLAVEAGQSHGKVLWLGAMESICEAEGLKREHGVYRVAIEQLMRAGGFTHLNCLILNRELWLNVGNMDEDIRWENDRDFYLRVIDNARQILFNPDVVSQHNVPDKSKTDNLTTIHTIHQRMNYQLYVLNKVALLTRSPIIAREVRLHTVYVLKKKAEQLYAEKRFDDALFYSRQALCAGRSWKWWLQHVRIATAGLLSRFR